MDALIDLQLGETVCTRGTNWEFVGTPSHPSWENTATGHMLAIFPSECDEYEYKLQLNHEDQLRPWWTITEEDFPAELIPVTEWVISTPDGDLKSRETVSCMLEPFWESEAAAPEKKTKQ